MRGETSLPEQELGDFIRPADNVCCEPAIRWSLWAGHRTALLRDLGTAGPWIIEEDVEATRAFGETAMQKDLKPWRQRFPIVLFRRLARAIRIYLSAGRAEEHLLLNVLREVQAARQEIATLKSQVECLRHSSDIGGTGNE